MTSTGSEVCQKYLCIEILRPIILEIKKVTKILESGTYLRISYYLFLKCDKFLANKYERMLGYAHQKYNFRLN